MKKVLLASLLTCLAIVSVRADYLWYEGFNYNNGAIETNSGGLWICHSPTTAANDALVTNKKLEIRGTFSGNPAGSGQDDIHRWLTITNGGPYTNSTTYTNYASFTVRFAQLPTPAGAYFANFYSSATVFPGRVWALAGTNLCLPGTFRLGVSGGSTPVLYPVDLATNTDYQVVMMLDQNNKSTYLWVNPLSSADCFVNSADTFTAANISGFGFRQATGFALGLTNNPILTISNLALATTFGEAATNVWPNTAVAPTIVVAPVNTTNFLGFPMSLTAVVNGQNLCGLTYQWKKRDTSNGNYTNILGATANVYSIASAAASDRGQYEVVATNPNSGLSATTTPVWLWVDTTLAPPQISQQPANTTVYYGATVGLSVTATGEEPLTWAWYYNTASNYSGSLIDGSTVGLTCTGEGTAALSIGNVRAGNNTVGYYYCKITGGNSLFTNTAIVKVSAIAVPCYTISYLRTLTDPVSYQSTNTTLLYCATGVITTYTNITSGDTSSYYLQDGTGGINIFATFGSTWRPNQGDQVTFVGALSTYQDNLELTSSGANLATGGTVLSSGNALPCPQIISWDYLNVNNNANFEYNVEGSLVMLTNVYFKNAGDTTPVGSNLECTVTNASGQVGYVYIYSGQDIDLGGQTIPAFAYTIVGPLIQATNTSFPTGYLVAPTRWADIVTTPLTIAATHAGTSSTITWTAVPNTYCYTVWAASTVTGTYSPIATGLHFATTAGTFTDNSAGGVEKFYRVSTP